MSDMISRQAAIDALAKAMPSLTTPDGSGEFDHDIQITDEAFVDCMQIINELPSAQPEIIYCKDCAKHNKGHGYYLDGTVIGIKDCCPLVEIRGMAKGHEFDYQYCAYAERRTDG